MSSPPASILVVDDDPNLLRMLRRGLVLAGYEVQAVEDGEAGLDAARRTAARLVELYFVFSRERYLGLKMYEARLRRMARWT